MNQRKSNEKDKGCFKRLYREGRNAENFLTQKNNLPPWSSIGENKTSTVDATLQQTEPSKKN
ncbi:hypothetical protein Q5Y73_15315 [Chengkuizengella sp. 2205SS18-9]|uniref:Uncharacterized protein n=1 Tax=Chengkuizengella axinellae TaxID=3064388 RepID=A0ABT9J225_9BACL|nr:hypothetical protein [Chengkuizengella sp. 2205SS18-9]MDP5275477.1 hypothetical protein [Chengkuizengella sp. 2205SS18-9]